MLLLILTSLAMLLLMQHSQQTLRMCLQVKTEAMGMDSTAQPSRQARYKLSMESAYQNCGQRTSVVFLYAVWS